MQAFYQADYRIAYGNTANNLNVFYSNYIQTKIENSYQKFENSIVPIKKIWASVFQEKAIKREQ